MSPSSENETGASMFESVARGRVTRLDFDAREMEEDKLAPLTQRLGKLGWCFV